MVLMSTSSPSSGGVFIDIIGIQLQYSSPAPAGSNSKILFKCMFEKRLYMFAVSNYDTYIIERG